MARCIVVGNSGKANSTADVLQELCVSAKAVNLKDHDQVLKLCRREQGMEVVVVFYNELHGDGMNFLQELRESMPSVRIHVLRKSTDAKLTDEELMEVPVDEILSSSPPPNMIAKSIMKRWFNPETKDAKPFSIILGPLEKLMHGWVQAKPVEDE